MNSPGLLISSDVTIIDYEIVEDKMLSTRIIVFIDIDYEELYVTYRDNEVYVIIYSGSVLEEKTLSIKLKRKIKKIRYCVKNGILTLDISYKIFPI